MPPKQSRLFRFPWRSRASIAQEVDVELDFHLAMRVSELTTQGLSADDARLRAREEFGDIEFTKRYCRDIDARTNRSARVADRIAEWRQDARFALRTLRRSPGFAAVSLITLALAVGANTAIFSVARAVLLAPLPYGDPGSLVSLFEYPDGNSNDKFAVSPPNFVDYQAQQHTLSDVAAYSGIGAVTWQLDNGDPDMASGVGVEANMFDVLRARPLQGRTFAPGEDVPGNNLKAVVSYGFAQRALGGRLTAAGRRLLINGRPYDIIGVMPPGFTLGMGEDVWLPLDLRTELADAVRTRKQHWVNSIGRLKPGVTLGAASADFGGIARRLEAQYPDANTGKAALLVPLREVMVGNLRMPLLLLQGAAAMVLLIACANLANLTLSRTAGRRREMALRAALGAGRGRLVRQLLTESVLLALVGGAIGVALAVVATRTLLSLNPEALPPMFAARLDGNVLLFSVGVSLATGVLFGLVPAFDAARADLHDSLKEGGRGALGGHGGDRMRRTLVVTQVGLAVMLLVGAGLLVRSFSELTRARLGFEPSHVLTAQIRTSGTRYDSSAAINRFYDAMLTDIAAAPGVVAAGATDKLPTRGRLSTSVRIEGEPVDEARLPDCGYISVRGDYFGAMHMTLVAGREYGNDDLPDGPKTVIINETAARQFFPKGDAIGRRIRIGPNPNGAWMTVVGIIGDIRDEGFGVATKPTLFANHRQETWERTMNVVVRTSGDPHTATPVLRRIVKATDPSLALRDVGSLDDVLGSSLAPRRFALVLASCFGVIALLLAAVGIYGVLAYAVSSRTREFGVRLALGASASSVLMLVARQGIAWSLLGLILGIGGAVAGRRLLSGMLYGVSAVDAATYVAVALSLLAVAAIACLIPALRATRVNPVTSMRAD